MAKLDKIKLDKAITQKYQIADNTFFAVPKSNPRDKVELEVGDSKTANEFLPQQKIKRWDNEVNCSLRLVHDEKSPEVITEDGKIKWKGSKVEAHFYDIKNDEHPKGASEFEILLLKDPRTKKTGNYQVKFTVVDKGVEYFKQPMERKQHPNGHWSCDENVLGSYAVYAKENKINWTGGKEYKCGKVGHIYRPRIEDSAGKWVWGDLNIANGFLTVDIPQEFLDKAVYPVKHAAGLTFGYTSAGSREDRYLAAKYSRAVNNRESTLVSSPVSNGTLDSLSAYLRADTTNTIDISAFVNSKDSGGSNSHNQIAFSESTNIAISTTVGWKTFSFASEAISSVTNYILNVLGNGAKCTNNTGVFIRSDSTSTVFYEEGFNEAQGKTYANGKEDPWTIASLTGNYRFSIYATYTAAPITKELAETVTHTDECRKQNSRYFLETVSHLSSLINQASRTFLETVNHTSSLIKLLGRILSETANHTSSVIKQNGRTLSDTVTHTDVFSSIKSKFSTLTDTVTHTSSLIRQNGRTILETVTHTDTFAKIKTFIRELTETANHTASVIKGAGRTISDTANHTSSLIKQNSRSLLDTATHTSTFSSIKSRFNTWTETVSHTDSLIKMCSRTILETANHTASVVKQGFKTFLETVNHTSSMVKDFQKILEETGVVFTASLVCLKVITTVYTEISSFTDTILKQTSKILSETSNFLAALVNQTNKTLEETVSFVDSLVRQIGRSFEETVSLLAEFFGQMESTGKVFEEVATFTDSFFKKVQKVFEEAFSNIDDFISQKILSVLAEEIVGFTDYLSRVISRTLEEVSSFAADVYKSISTFFEEVSTFTDSISKGLNKILIEAISFTEEFLKTISKTIEESASFTANIYKGINILFQETTTFTDFILRQFNRTITESVSFADSFIKQTVRVFSEIISHSSSFISNRLYIFSATVNFSSSLSTFFSKTLTLQEIVSLVDSIRSYLNGIRAGLWAMIGKATDKVWTKVVKATDGTWSKTAKPTNNNWDKTPKE